jgi:hypothetical protein
VTHSDISGSTLTAERADSVISLGWRHFISYPTWKISHEVRRRIHLIRSFGLSAAVSPSKLERHF